MISLVVALAFSRFGPMMAGLVEAGYNRQTSTTSDSAGPSYNAFLTVGFFVQFFIVTVLVYRLWMVVTTDPSGKPDGDQFGSSVPLIIGTCLFLIGSLLGLILISVSTSASHAVVAKALHLFQKNADGSEDYKDFLAQVEFRRTHKEGCSRAFCPACQPQKEELSLAMAAESAANQSDTSYRNFTMKSAAAMTNYRECVTTTSQTLRHVYEDFLVQGYHGSWATPDDAAVYATVKTELREDQTLQAAGLIIFAVSMSLGPLLIGFALATYGKQGIFAAVGSGKAEQSTTEITKKEE